MLDAGAEVTVIAPEINSEITELADSGRIFLRKRKYASPEVVCFRLVIAATDDEAVNRKIYTDCLKRLIPVNVVDQPELCTVIFPSIIRKGNITAAISSGGTSPFFTKVLRKRIEELLKDIFQLDKPELLVMFRDFVRENTDDWDIKQKMFDKIIECDKETWENWSVETPPVTEWRKWLEELNK